MFTIHAGETVNGSSRRPTNIEVNETGVAVGAFKRVMNPWSEVMAVEIFGPDSQTSRVTATRLAALGILAFAFKKSTTETLVVLSLKSGETKNLMFLKKSEPEVRALFSPFLARVLNSAEKVSNEGRFRTSTDLENSAYSKAAEIKGIVEMYEKGLIDEFEFGELKRSVLGGRIVETNQRNVDQNNEIASIHVEQANSTTNVRETFIAEQIFRYTVSGWSIRDIEELTYEVGLFMYDSYFFPKRSFNRTRKDLRTKKLIELEVRVLEDQLVDNLVNKFNCQVEIELVPLRVLNLESRDEGITSGVKTDVSSFRDVNALQVEVQVGILNENFHNREVAWKIFQEYGLPSESLNYFYHEGFSLEPYELPCGVPLISLGEDESDLLVWELDQIGFTAERFWTQPIVPIFQ